MIDIDGNDTDKKPKAKRAPPVKKPVVSAEECKRAAVVARSKLLTLQKDLTELIKGLEDVAANVEVLTELVGRMAAGLG